MISPLIPAQAGTSNGISPAKYHEIRACAGMSGEWTFLGVSG